MDGDDRFSLALTVCTFGSVVLLLATRRTRYWWSSGAFLWLVAAGGIVTAGATATSSHEDRYGLTGLAVVVFGTVALVAAIFGSIFLAIGWYSRNRALREMAATATPPAELPRATVLRR
jgi:hypothetical protein